jgi:hypothetical protein
MGGGEITDAHIVRRHHKHNFILTYFSYFENIKGLFQNNDGRLKMKVKGKQY